MNAPELKTHPVHFQERLRQEASIDPDPVHTGEVKSLRGTFPDRCGNHRHEGHISAFQHAGQPGSLVSQGGQEHGRTVIDQ